MRSIGFNISGLFRRVRLLAAACLCALVLVSYALPAYSATSSTTSGETNLLDIEGKSQEAISGKKPSDFDIKKQQDETHPGLNEIQGTADADKMKRPENTSSGTKSVEEIIGKTLKKATGDND